MVIIVSGCAGTTTIRETMNLRKDELSYERQSGTIPDKTAGTVSIGSFVVEDVLTADTVVERTSTFILPLLLVNFWNNELIVKPGHKQIVNDYREFLRQSLIDEIRASGNHIYQNQGSEYTLDVAIKKINIFAPVYQQGSMIVFYIILGGSRTTAGPAYIEIVADVTLKRGKDILFNKPFQGKYKTPALTERKILWQEYTSILINGLSLAIKDMNSAVVKALNAHGAVGIPALSSVSASAALATSDTSASIAGESFTDPVTGMVFVFVKGGCYRMGDIFGHGRSRETPVHEVCLDDFYLSRNKVTQDQWKSIMGTNPSHGPQNGNYPVNDVHWEDAHTFALLLKQKTGRRYRLPTEAEWEYAARSGGKDMKWAGTNNEAELSNYAWYSPAKVKSGQPAGGKKPNELGLHDMGGNLKEWVWDWYSDDYYNISPKDNPRGPRMAEDKVLRGGSYDSDAYELRTTHRDKAESTTAFRDFGFRLAIQIK